MKQKSKAAGKPTSGSSERKGRPASPLNRKYFSVEANAEPLPFDYSHFLSYDLERLKTELKAVEEKKVFEF